MLMGLVQWEYTNKKKKEEIRRKKINGFVNTVTHEAGFAYPYGVPEISPDFFVVF